MAVSYPTIVYGQSSSITTSPRVIRSEYGDGYGRNIADGINYLPRSGTLVHPLIDNTTAATLLAFLRANNQGIVVTIINYMEDPTGATTLNVRIMDWNHTFDGVTQTYNVNFVEAFAT